MLALPAVSLSGVFPFNVLYEYLFPETAESRPAAVDTALTMDSPNSDEGHFTAAHHAQSEADSSDFSCPPSPRSTASSMASSDFHSHHLLPTAVHRPAEPSRTASTSTTSSVSSSASSVLNGPADPLSRVYPKPIMEVDVAEALAREPLRWSLGYWAKNAKEKPAPVPSRELEARRFEEAKRELLKAKAEMAQLSSKGRRS